jgi:hypothetical protein
MEKLRNLPYGRPNGTRNYPRMTYDQQACRVKYQYDDGETIRGSGRSKHQHNMHVAKKLTLERTIDS